MVTGRVPKEKKAAGNLVLQRAGMNASQAVNRMYDRLIEDQGTAFLESGSGQHTEAEWRAAVHLVDSIPSKRSSRFDDMSRSEIKAARLRARGLL